MSHPQPVRLSAGQLDLTLLPALGAGIARFDFRYGTEAIPILRPSPEDPASVLELANFPLVPFVNRVRGGRFMFRGREVMLAPNMPGDPSPLHGQGWLSEWNVESADGAEARLTFRHRSGDWPWDYEAWQHFRLDEGGLSLELGCRNLSADPMPCGLGQHPYLPCDAGTRLDTEVTHVWTIDENVLPVEKIPATGRYDLNDRQVCGQNLDHGFGGWGGEARVTNPALPFEVVISSPDARFFQVYSPEEGGFFVAEPVGHVNAAMNAPEEEWPELGFGVLEPGAEMTFAMRIDVRATTNP